MDIAPKNSKLLLQLMSATTLRARVLAANVANQNTPGFRRRDVNFEKALRAELQRGERADLSRLNPEVFIDQEAQPRADGNTVDMEMEVSASRENRLVFELYASILRGQTRLTQLAVRNDR